MVTRIEKPLYTNLDIDEYLRLPRIYGRYDIIDGNLVMSPSPTPAHQWYSKEIFNPLDSFIENNDLGVVLFAPVDMLIRQYPKLRMRQPDLLYLSRERSGISGINELETKPFVDEKADLVVEILSGDEWRSRLPRKLEDYASIGVLEVWVASRQTESIEVLEFRDGEYARAGIYGPGETLRSVVLPGFELPVDSVFGR